MTIELYGMGLSAPARIACLTLEALGKEYNYKVVNLWEGEHKTSEFLKMNPQHNIPVLKDGDFVLNESRVIATYLATVYGKNSETTGLYPTDPKIRAIVDQRLYFDSGVFYKAFGDIVYPNMGIRNASVGEEQHDRFKEVIGWVSDFLSATGFVAGTKELSLADLAFAATYGTIKATGAFDEVLGQFPAIDKWYDSIAKAIPNFDEANTKGAQGFGDFYKSKI